MGSPGPSGLGHSTNDIPTIILTEEEGSSTDYEIIQPTSVQPNASTESEKVQTTKSTSWLDGNQQFWEKYKDVADFDDKEFVKFAGGSLDTLLIFAGLFSAVNTAFIIESIKSIQPDKMDENNELLRTFIRLSFHNTTSRDTLPNIYSPTSSPQGVRCTTILFSSLSCSLAAAFGAVLGKQWLNHYEHEGGLKPLPSRGRERQKKYEGRTYWHMQGIIDMLPTLLQISLFLFLAALVEFLQLIKLPGVNIAISLALGAPFYLITTAIAVAHPFAPFQTPVSIKLNTISQTFFQSKKDAKIVLVDIFQHPFSELFELLKLSKLLDILPFGLRQSCATLVTIILWPPSLAWRFMSFAAYQARNLFHYFTTFTIDAEDGVQDLKCLIYYGAKLGDKAPSNEDLELLRASMSALPENFKLSADHPVLIDLGKVLSKFALNNVIKSYDRSFSLPDDFEYFLNPLRLLYSSWKHLQDPITDQRSWQYFAPDLIGTIWERLWKLLDKNSKDPVLVSAAADIFDTPLPYPIYGSPLDHCTSQDTIGKSLIESISKEQYTTPYVNLLAILLNSSRNRIPNFPEGTDVASLVPHILSTLPRSADEQLVSEQPVSSIVWAELLPEYLQGKEQVQLFSKYLARSCKDYLPGKEKMDWLDRRREELSYQAHWFCVRAIYKLLRQNPNSSEWSQVLENVGFPSLLLKICRRTKFKSMKGLAILGFVSLWQARGPQTPDSSDKYLGHRSVGTVVRLLRCIADVDSYALEGLDARHIPQIVDNVLDYLQAASEAGRLKYNMADGIRDFMNGPSLGHIPQDRKDAVRERLLRLSYM